jgi:Ca2+-transporting ATPase
MASPFLWHTQEVGAVAHELKTDLEQGLSYKESASRLTTYGPNELPEKGRIPWANIFLRQHISLMIPILVLASIILILTGEPNSAAVVIGILIANIILSGSQEAKSERLLRYLRRLANTSMYAKALRSGHVSLVKATDLVPGDIICFETGDQIAADGRLVEAEQLTIDESVLMEATEPVEKDVAVLGEDVPVHLRKSIVFMGTMVTNGTGRAIITATGIQTQLAQMSEDRTGAAKTVQRFLGV